MNNNFVQVDIKNLHCEKTTFHREMSDFLIVLLLLYSGFYTDNVATNATLFVFLSLFYGQLVLVFNFKTELFIHSFFLLK